MLLRSSHAAETFHRRAPVISPPSSAPPTAVGAITITGLRLRSLGAMPINIDASGVDVAFSCTQKGLSCPPGLSPITVSPTAVERLRARKAPCPIWYLDLKLLLDYYEGAHRYHHTAPISRAYALREGLALVQRGRRRNPFRLATATHSMTSLSAASKPPAWECSSLTTHAVIVSTT